MFICFALMSAARTSSSQTYLVLNNPCSTFQAARECVLQCKSNSASGMVYVKRIPVDSILSNDFRALYSSSWSIASMFQCTTGRHTFEHCWASLSAMCCSQCPWHVKPLCLTASLCLVRCRSSPPTPCMQALL